MSNKRRASEAPSNNRPSSRRRTGERSPSPAVSVNSDSFGGGAPYPPLSLLSPGGGRHALRTLDENVPFEENLANLGSLFPANPYTHGVGLGDVDDMTVRRKTLKLTENEEISHYSRNQCLEVLHVRLVECYLHLFVVDLCTNLLIFRSLQAMDVLGLELHPTVQGMWRVPPQGVDLVTWLIDMGRNPNILTSKNSHPPVVFQTRVRRYLDYPVPVHAESVPPPLALMPPTDGLSREELEQNMGQLQHWQGQSNESRLPSKTPMATPMPRLLRLEHNKSLMICAWHTV